MTWLHNWAEILRLYLVLNWRAFWRSHPIRNFPLYVSGLMLIGVCSIMALVMLGEMTTVVDLLSAR